MIKKGAEKGTQLFYRPGVAVLHLATNFQVVRPSEGFDLIAKSPPRLAESFVDIRAYTVSDWSGHPQLASALVQANQQHLILDRTANAFQQSIHQVLPAAGPQ